MALRPSPTLDAIAPDQGSLLAPDHFGTVLETHPLALGLDGDASVDADAESQTASVSRGSLSAADV